MSAPMRGHVEEGDSPPPISVRPKLRASASLGRGRGRGRIAEQGQVGASCGRGFRNARGVIQCHGCGFQANSTREFSEHATQSQGSIGDVGGLKGECQTGFGGGDSKVEKQTVVDHMTKKFAGDPNDLRSRIVQRSGTTAEKGAGSAGRVEDRQAHPNVWPRSDGVPNLSGGIPRVNLPTGKPVPPPPCTSSIPQQTEVRQQPRQPPNLGFEQHYPIDAHQQQVLSSFQHLQQPALQLPPSSSVSSRCILLLEREVQLQEDLAVVIGQKSVMRDTDSRECYIAVLKQEIAIRKQLEQVTKELEQEQALAKKQDNLSTIFVPSVQPAASLHLHPGSSYGAPGDLRREEDVRQAALVLEQQKRSLLWKGEAGSAAGPENFGRSTPSDLLYDSDSEEEEAEANRGVIASSGQRIQNLESEEDGMSNLEVKRQQMLILEKIKEEQQNEKKSLELIAKLSLEETSGETRGASAGVTGKLFPTMQFPPSRFPGLEEKRSKAELSASERIAALKAAAVAQGTYVDTNSREFVTGGSLSRVGLDKRADRQIRKEEEEKLQGQEAEAPKNGKPVKLGDWGVSNAPRRSSVEITNVAFKKKNLEKSKKKEEEKGMRSRRNSEAMAEMDAERKLHANIIKERAAVQAREKLASQREVVVAKEWEEASRRKELAEKARLAGTVAAGETPGSKRSSRDKSKDKPTKEQRSNRWSSVGHGAKAKPSNPRSRRTSGK